MQCAYIKKDGIFKRVERDHNLKVSLHIHLSSRCRSLGIGKVSFSVLLDQEKNKTLETPVPIKDREAHREKSKDSINILPSLMNGT